MENVTNWLLLAGLCSPTQCRSCWE